MPKPYDRRAATAKQAVAQKILETLEVNERYRIKGFEIAGADEFWLHPLVNIWAEIPLRQFRDALALLLDDGLADADYYHTTGRYTLTTKGRNEVASLLAGKMR